jgi:AcrR family transcriptional regulator
MRACYDRGVDDRLLDAAVAVLAEHGHAGLTLERVADRAGRSRVTLWRQQVTQEALVDGLLARLTRDFRDAMWPALAEGGTGAERLASALTALCDVADAHLPLLAVSDDVFDRAADRMRDITGQTFSRRFADHPRRAGGGRGHLGLRGDLLGVRAPAAPTRLEPGPRPGAAARPRPGRPDTRRPDLTARTARPSGPVAPGAAGPGPRR